MTRKCLYLLPILALLPLVACGGDEFEPPQGTGGTAGSGGTGAAANGGTAGGSEGGAGGMTSGGVGGTSSAGTGGATGGTGGGPLVDCTGQDDGTVCEGEGDNTLCVNEQCVQSECGDGYPDEANDETCDDGKNGDDTDGCTDECKATCTTDADCDDGNACNGAETCSDQNTCELGQAVNCDDGNACTSDSCVAANGSCAHEALDDGAACGTGKICLAESCKTSVCGDRYVDAAKGEECDDGKDGDNTDGCKDDCKFTCKTNTDCNDDNACTTDACNTSAHTCTNTAITCNDSDACTADTCAPATGCVYTFIDEDKDGYSPNACKAGGPYANKGGDCRDTGTNAAVVNPGVTGYFSIDHGVPGLTSYDYNCSNKAEQESTSLFDGTCNSNFEAGWKNAAFAPGCGQTGTWHSCLLNQDTQRTQACH